MSWRLRPPRRTSLTFVVGVQYPVVGSAFARIPSHRPGLCCRPEPRGSASLGPLPRRLALRPVVPRHWGTSCMRGVTGMVGSWGGPWLVVVAFATAASYFPHLRRWCPYPVVGSTFARIPTHPLCSRCRPGLGFYPHAVPPLLGSRHRPWPPYPALGWGRSVHGFHPTTGRSSSLLAIRPIVGCVSSR